MDSIRSAYPATMMMASLQQNQPGKSPPRKRRQGNRIVGNEETTCSRSSSENGDPQVVIGSRDILRRTEKDSSTPTEDYANPPLLPDTENPNDQSHPQQHDRHQPLIYVNRSKIVTGKPCARVEEGEAVDDGNADEARRRLRLSYIKSAARAIDEQAASGGVTTDTKETMPAFAALSEGGCESTAARQQSLAPSRKHLPEPKSPHRSMVAAAAPISPSLTAPVTPLSLPDRSAARNSDTRDVATSVASAAAAVALQQQQQQQQQHQQVLQRGIPHVYHDFASVPDSAGYVRKKTGGVTQPFPEKLHELLEKESTPDFHLKVHAIVGWLPHGRAFLVRKPKEFTQNIMPKYFRQTKLTSFQRQLNLYGFRRLTQGADAGAYYHELFLRGRPQLCLRMVRQKVKGTGHKQPADAQTEPNFYTLPPASAPNSPSAVVPIAPLSPRPASPPKMAVAASPAGGNLAPYSPEDEMSPGTRGVHGAASLLKGLAAGVAPGRLKSIHLSSAIPFLGPPAEDAFDGSKTRAVGRLPMKGAARSVRVLSQEDRPTVTNEEEKNEKVEGLAPFSFSPQRSSYSSLLWGGVTPARQPTAGAPAFFLLPQSATVAAAATESREEDDKTASVHEHEEAS